MATYKVKTGDTLSKIASQLGVPVSSISGYASGNPNQIGVGENLSYGEPQEGDYVVGKGILTPTGTYRPTAKETTLKTAPVTSYLTSTTSKDNAPSQFLPDGSINPAYGGKLQDRAGTDPEAQKALAEQDLLNSKNNPDINAIRPRQKGETTAEYRARLQNESFFLPGGNNPKERPKTLTAGEIRGLGEASAFKGTGFDLTSLAGLTREGVLAELAKKKKELLGNVSQNTSFAYNNEAFNPKSKVKSILDTYQIGLKDAMSPWNLGEEKTDKKNVLLQDAVSQISGAFTNAGEFDSLYKTDGDFRSAIDRFAKQGVKIADIKSKIGGGAVSVIGENDNGDGTRTVRYSDGTTGQVTSTKNANGTESYKEFNSADGSPLLKSDNPLIDKLLSPQTQTAQANIDYLKSVPEQYRSLYFGDAGYFTKMRQEAEQSVKTLSESYAKVQKDTIADFESQARKNEADAKVQLATIEENRATNKNYLNGMLAKLGALTTTGEAPAAISRLDAKYDTLSSQTQTALSTAQSALNSAKSKAISTLENDRLSKVSAIRSDLSKSSFEIQKELMSVEKETRKAINDQITDWQKQATAINKSFIDKANAQKNQYEQLYFKTVSGNMSAKMLAELKKNQPLTVKEASDYGVPYGTTYAQLEGKVLPRSAELKPTTEAQAKEAGFASRMKDTEEVFSDPNGGDKALAKINPAMLGMLLATQEPADGFLGNMKQQATYSLIPDNIKSQFQAQRNFVNAVLRKESGAAISAGEFSNAVSQYFPQAGDPADVLAQKKQNRMRKYQEALLGAGETAVDRFQNVDLGGSQFSDPAMQSDGYNGGAVDWGSL